MVSLVDPKYWEKWSNSNLSEIQNTNSEQRDKNEKEKNNKLTHVILYCDPLCYIFIGMDKYIYMVLFKAREHFYVLIHKKNIL